MTTHQSAKDVYREHKAYTPGPWNMNVQDTLERELTEAAESWGEGGTGNLPWFKLAVVAVRALISIASALWDK